MSLPLISSSTISLSASSWCFYLFIGSFCNKNTTRCLSNPWQNNSTCSGFSKTTVAIVQAQSCLWTEEVTTWAVLASLVPVKEKPLGEHPRRKKLPLQMSPWGWWDHLWTHNSSRRHRFLPTRGTCHQYPTHPACASAGCAGRFWAGSCAAGPAPGQSWWLLLLLRAEPWRHCGLEVDKRVSDPCRSEATASRDRRYTCVRPAATLVDQMMWLVSFLFL